MRALARKCLPLTFLVVVFAFAFASSTLAASTSAIATVDSTKPTLEKASAGGWTTSVGITNLTTDKLEVSLVLVRPGPEDCTPTVPALEIKYPEKASLKVSVPSTCDVGKSGIRFRLIAEAADESQLFVINAKEDDAKATTGWWTLWTFLGFFVLFVLVFFLVRLKSMTPLGVLKTRAEEALGKAEEVELDAAAAVAAVPPAERDELHRLWVASEQATADAEAELALVETNRSQEGWGAIFNAPLKHLGATWSFNDSTISSVTLAGGLLTAIFANDDTVMALLGVDEAPSLSLSIVGVAVSAAIVAGAPLLLSATSVTPDKTDPLSQYFSMGGLKLASAMVISAALGLLVVVYKTGMDLGLQATAETWLTVSFALAGILTVVYGVRSTWQTIRVGVIPPTTAPAPPSETELAIQTLAEVLKVMTPSSGAEVDRSARNLKSSIPGDVGFTVAMTQAADTYQSDLELSSEQVERAKTLAMVASRTPSPAQVAVAPRSPAAMI